MNDELQLELCDIFSKYCNEWDKLNELSWGGFGEIDREILYCMVRHFKPSKIIEIGSGASTYILITAISANKKEGKSAKLLVVDPYPSKTFQKFLNETDATLIKDKCENLSLDLFLQLKSNDILFIDSTHIVKTSGEVNYLFLEVMPRLNNGIIVHIHDIFLPLEYPEEWIIKKHRFWTEQYLLHAFLIYNNCFEVLWGGSYMHIKYPEKLREVFPITSKVSPGSFWIRKKC
jgi:hypothetical protein